MALTISNLRSRGLAWLRRWSKKEWAIAIGVFTITLFALTLIPDSFTEPLYTPPPPLDSTADFVDLTLLHKAKPRGALCLDGSVPAYHFHKGFGSGSANWLLHIEGGGWCNSVASCSLRKKTALGSSNYMEPRVRFSGILSPDPSQNPDFFNWNKVKIRYCDGASFAGHSDNELKTGDELFFRGQLIWKVVMDELLSLGLSRAKQALLSGCSAGGLATLIHCDDFRKLLPEVGTVKCLADAGFFLNEKDVLGNLTMRSFYHDVLTLQGVAESLPKECVAKSEPSECLFPHQIIKNINTPVFLVNPAYDFWQIQHILIPDSSDPRGYWQKCRRNIHNCSPSQIEILHGFRDSLLRALSDFQRNKEGGVFINSCFAHCQTWMAETWHSASSPRINSKTIAESVGDWYFNRRVVKQVDCPYPCNPTCIHMDFP
ncbi:Pectinacetylesterase/NOTUM [Trema orientale]|uniref:Pectin acetylesterase n=1 Tax=Trema orientale TaxID=63057 RepID=A0A2P5DS68_TREOI|nr:Pectinacetylesterase/NOTUM [Trema orientale]